jgi:hypothetical protein
MVGLLKRQLDGNQKLGRKNRSFQKGRNMNRNLQFYAVFKNEDGLYELWGGPCTSKEAALNSGEMKVLDTYGSKSKNYSKRVNGLTAVNKSEARYLKVI